MAILGTVVGKRVKPCTAVAVVVAMLNADDSVPCRWLKGAGLLHGRRTKSSGD